VRSLVHSRYIRATVRVNFADFSRTFRPVEIKILISCESGPISDFPENIIEILHSKFYNPERKTPAFAPRSLLWHNPGLYIVT